MKEKDALLCLGIESTAHTFGASLVTSQGEILSDEKATLISPPGKGIHPRESAQHHSEKAAGVVAEAFRKAHRKPGEVKIVAFSQGPGLGPCLRSGATVARSLAAYLGVPLVPVHHAIAHIELAALTTGAQDPLTLLVSGGHTAITAHGGGRWRIFGETEDITLGNLLDMFGRKAGLPSPSGPAIEKSAGKGSRYLELPYVVKGNDVSYSGVLTSAVKQLKEGVGFEDLCFSLQETAFAMVAEATERALAFTEKRELLLAGGVAANGRLQRMMGVVAGEHDASLRVVPRQYSGDCGAQIAWTGILAHERGVGVEVARSFVKPRWRMDQVPVPWRWGKQLK